MDLTLLASIYLSSSPIHMSPGGTSFLSVYLYICTDSTAQTISHPGLLPGLPFQWDKNQPPNPDLLTALMHLHQLKCLVGKIQSKAGKQDANAFLNIFSEMLDPLQSRT